MSGTWKEKVKKTYTFQVSWQFEPFYMNGSLSTKPALCKGWYNGVIQKKDKKMEIKVAGYCILIKTWGWLRMHKGEEKKR